MTKINVPGGWASYQIFRKGGLVGSQFLEEGCLERGGDFFREGLQFFH